MTDAAGLTGFLQTIGEFASGKHAPSVAPVWERHLLSARVPLRVTQAHREYEEQAAVDMESAAGDGDNLVGRSFFFARAEISAIRRLLQPDLSNNSTDLETLTSFLWRYRTVALRPDPNKEMRIMFIVNARSKLKLPTGYYGNAFAFPVAIATARDLTERSLEFAMALVKEAKSSVTEEYMRSLADLMVTKGRPSFLMDGACLISDARIFADIDFGIWGKPVYGGVGTAGIAEFPVASFCVPFENRKGETGFIVPVCLPEKAMQRFVDVLDEVFNGDSVSSGRSKKNP
ncbi:unnamed protein product [Arabis nemorensis]|uniref:Benzyl alcohol O-benzoyltransferase n=1 Tax=Arabis nemorensis TaxID=586526 RepID=A0A565BFX5_9BRAS|nr:unnamed protein product [Arabis nemorensis]